MSSSLEKLEASRRKRARRAEREAQNPELAEIRKQKDRDRHRASWPDKRDAQNARKRQFREDNPELVKLWHANSYKRNRPKFVENRKRRKVSKINATPSWLTAGHIAAMQAIYIESERLTRETGVKHNVDHLYPLKGADVCGLHVPWNLVVIPALENNQKNNRHPEKFYGDRFPEMLAKTTPTTSTNQNT